MPNISVAAAAKLNTTRTDVNPARNRELQKWVYTPKSSWVYGLRYQAVMTAHDIQYKDKLKRLTALCRYPGTHINTYHAMRRAMSKGKFVHRNLYRKPYILLKGKRPKRKASMRIRGLALKKFGKAFKTIGRKPFNQL